MKTNKLIAIFVLGALLCASPAYAQSRGGGGGSRGGGSHSSSSSHSGGSHSSSSHSSSSSRGSSSVSSSRSSSPSSSRSNSVSRSNSSSRSSATYTPSHNSVSRTPNHNNSSETRGTVNNGNRGSQSTMRGSSSVGRPSSTTPGRVSSRRSASSSENSSVTRENNTSARGGGVRENPQRGGGVNGPGNGPGNGHQGVNSVGRGHVNPNNSPDHTYARPGRPGPMPPSHRPMHPAPYFHHPYHHGMIHMHPIIWHPVPPRPLFWPGFWLYCNSYWYDYHVTDVVVVNRYVKETYNVDMVSYVVSGDIMYAIVNDVDGNTYLQVFDQNDKLLAEQKISSKYIKTEIDRENGGCWIFKKKDKDPMLFLYVDGELLIYEAD